MSDSVQPHRRQHTRLHRPWDSPSKNTGVDCHFLLQCMKVKSEREVAQSCPTLSDPMDCSPPGSSVHGSFQARVLEWGATAFPGAVHYPFLCVWVPEGISFFLFFSLIYSLGLNLLSLMINLVFLARIRLSSHSSWSSGSFHSQWLCKIICPI